MATMAEEFISRADNEFGRAMLEAIKFAHANEEAGYSRCPMRAFAHAGIDRKAVRQAYRAGAFAERGPEDAYVLTNLGRAVGACLRQQVIAGEDRTEGKE